MRTFLLIVVFEVFLINSVASYIIESQNSCLCSNCLDCNEALNSKDCKSVKLINDIINFNETCIKNPPNFINKIFDCQYHKIKGSNINETYGIYLENKSNNVIKNCIIEGFDYGIYLSHSSDNFIINNSINDNKWDGIYLLNSHKNKLTGNDIKVNGRNGIYLSYSSNNEIAYNIAERNIVGINLGYSINNTIINNTISGNKMDGIAISFSEKNIIEINNASNNNIGVFIDASSNNTIKNNNMKSNNYAGIYLFHNSSSNKIFNNEIVENGEIGIAISNCYPRGYYCVEGCENNVVEENKITKNRFGIYSNESSSIFSRNIVCENLESDFYSYDWVSSYGDNNVCDKTDGWKDDNKLGCSQICEELQKDNRDRKKDSMYILMLVFLPFLFIFFWFVKRK